MTAPSPSPASSDREGDLVLDVRDLKTHFFTEEGPVKAVDGVSLMARAGRTLCVVGESGCGKSVTARSILRIVDTPGRIVDGHIRFHRRGEPEPVDLATLDPKGAAIRSIRGNNIAMIFQEPMTSLSPVHTIGDQITEVVQLHRSVSAAEARRRAVDMLDRVGIPRAGERFDSYPFQLSGGMRQRAVIAMALICEPQLLVADEPTTALDVTTQAGILDLISDLQDEFGMAVIFITHDLGVVAEVADEVAVMYLGQVVENGPVGPLFESPKHPYTRALLRAIPRLTTSAEGRLATIRGIVPHPTHRPDGCPFHPRCQAFMPGFCDRVVPPVVTVGSDRKVRCLLYTTGESQFARVPLQHVGPSTTLSGKTPTLQTLDGPPPVTER